MSTMYNHADWDLFSTNSPDGFHDGRTMYYTLAQAICCTMTTHPQWQVNYLTDVLDHLFWTPTQWKRDNVAGFLLFCSEKVRK